MGQNINNKMEKPKMLFEIKERFKLSENFLSSYKDKQPDWGPLGYVTYKRTYARNILKENRTEEYWETLKRVVEGCYTTQLNHCKNLRLPWNAHKAQKSAQTMFQLMWDFKFLPPGRGLWAMGADYIWERGSAALNNCAFVSTEEIGYNASDPFCFLMDMSMLGVGVAFDTKGAGKVEIREPKIGDYIYTVDDSKEGWVDIIKCILDSYFSNSKIPKQIDYSKIRPEGSLIKTFGGIAPGPEPLKLCIKEIIEILNNRIGEKITTSDIVDLMNIIGKCVVSGGVRRTAELALGNIDDDEYLTLKDYETNGDKLMSWRWASNNSILSHVGMDYSKVSKQTAKNGEPGYFWLENAQKYGRLKDGENWKDIKVTGTNPCITGDTLIATADGRGSVRIDEIEDGTPVYTLDENKKIEIRPIHNPRITGYQKPIYKMTLDDGMEIRCTDNHKFRKIKETEFTELKNLKIGDRLNVFTKYIPDKRSISRTDNYISFSTGDDFVQCEHMLIAKAKGILKDSKKFHVHHKDENPLNNNWNNIEVLPSTEHLKNHSQGEKNGNSTGITNEELVEKGKELCQKLGRRFLNTEWEIFASENGLPRVITGFRHKFFGGPEGFSIKCAVEANVEITEGHYHTLRSYEDLIQKGYDCYFENNEIKIVKQCKHCQKEFIVTVYGKHQVFCSENCRRKGHDYSKNQEGQIRYFAEQKEKKREQQIELLLDLKQELGRLPDKKEWEQRAKEKGVIKRFGSPGSPFATWKELKETADSFNHRIVDIQFEGYEDVWNCTIPDFHNYFIGGQEGLTPKGRNKICYVNCKNCGEQSLESEEICNLVETFPSRHDTYEEYQLTLKFAYLYAKSVTLIPTHNERTNAVLLRNRRIGLSQSGIVESFAKHGRRTHFNWCDKGYNYITQLDKKYSSWLCIPESNKKTTVKPSGTVSLLPGVTPGIHYAHSKFYYRTIRIANGSPLIKPLEVAGFYIEDSLCGDNSKVVYFPVKTENFDRAKDEVSIWEQMENVAQLQYYWADNQVSATVTFNEEEAKDIHRVLELYENKIKGISFLPMTNHQYVQAPYQTIDEQTYLDYKSKIEIPDFTNMNTDEELELYCDGDSCQISSDSTNGKVHGSNGHRNNGNGSNGTLEIKKEQEYILIE
ncbi:MAG: hypothetical protein ACOCQD_02680 [archaeon]